ncbi:MAG: hypothetical protein F6K31_09535 [Symploca sp. SIO2G7]|nr:hypothetical protein [Symploca sp. SIO2G7]
MPKIIPKFHLPKEYPEDMKLLAEALLNNDGENLKSVVNWLVGKMVSHSGRTSGQPKSKTTIKNYLDGFYVLDLFSSDNFFYSDKLPLEKVSLSLKSKIRVKQSLTRCLSSSSVEEFNEQLTQLCSEQSLLVKNYNNDRRFLQEKHDLPETPNPSLLREMLVKHCNYSYVGHPGIGYINIFYQDKIQIDGYLNLMNFIVENYGDMAQKRLGLIPIASIFENLKKISDYTDENFKKHLIQLQLTHRIELRTTKSQLARNMGIDLVDIRGVKYGFIKILEPAIVV